MVRACSDEYRSLLEFARARISEDELSDLIYALAAHARLREHRASIMRSVASGAGDAAFGEGALSESLEQLRRLATYDRKARSQLNRLLAKL